jgi:LmbE family N-acetylglucosaminyl deacetylase
LGAELIWGEFPDCAIPEGQDSTAVVEHAIAACRADMVYSHTPNDSHQDHRATAAATLSAARRLSRVLCYEAPSSLGFAPSIYVDVDGLVDNKTDLLRAHMSQVLSCGLVDLEAIEAQARYRGFQARLRHAEAFETPRLVLDIHASTQPQRQPMVERRAALRPPLTTPIKATSVDRLAIDGMPGQASDAD